jgi:hypothetical protein
MRHLRLSLLLLLSLFKSALFAQGTSGTYGNLNVTGTATISGTLDVPSNNTYFGTVTGGTSAVTTGYYDGTSGTGATLTSGLTRPSAAWIWGHITTSGSATPAMALSASNNQLILTGTQASSPGSIILDPTAGKISVNGAPVLLSGTSLIFNSYGDLGIGTTSPDAQLDVEGSGNVILNAGEVGIGANPTTQPQNSGAPVSDLFISDPVQASINLTTTANGSDEDYTASIEMIQFNDGPGNNLVGQIDAQDAGFPAVGLYQPKQLAIWSGGPGGILILARDWPYYPSGVSGTGGPIVFASGHYDTGEAMRITPARYVGIGTSTPQRLLDVNGFARFKGAIVASGTLISGTYVTSGTNLALVPQQGDVSMGNFTGGAIPQ